MRRGDIVATILERKIVRARIFDWNGNLQSHVKLVDALRNPYKVYPWQCYGAGQFTRDGRVLMTQAQAAETRAATAFLDAKHERRAFAEFFAARADSVRHADGRTTQRITRDPYLMGPAATLDHPTEHGRLEAWDMPDRMVARGFGYDHEAEERYNPRGMTMDRQLERYLSWSVDWADREAHALDLLAARSPKQAEVWKRCVKGDSWGRTERQVVLAREWGVSRAAVTRMKRRAETFMVGYLGIDPRQFYASYDVGFNWDPHYVHPDEAA